MNKTPAKKKPPEVTSQNIQVIPIKNKITITISDFKDRLDFIESWYNSIPEKQQQRQEKTKQLLRNLTESILSKHYNDFNKIQYDLFLRVIDDWYNKDISHQLNFIKKILSDIKQSPTQQHQQVKPLPEKINWTKEPELLRTHLEKLRDDNFIQYNNIDEVMSGSEIAVFIKHKTYTAPCNNILALYDLWNEKKYISDYADREGKRQYKEFMENVFNWEESGKIKPVNHKSMKSIYSERIKKITEVKKHFESVL
jgi:hypothetical protein